MKPVEIRAPRPDDMHALARLKVEWARLDPPPSSAAQWAYADDLRSWLDRMGDRVVCRVAAAGGDLVGMAWMVVYDRVPDLMDKRRRTGDVQSVYVVPAKRGHGVGRALIGAICEEADARGIPRLTVHSTERAVPVYEAVGFSATTTLLERVRPRA
jgi:GNAT superfamily N-acetyltransferase